MKLTKASIVVLGLLGALTAHSQEGCINSPINLDTLGRIVILPGKFKLSPEGEYLITPENTIYPASWKRRPKSFTLSFTGPLPELCMYYKDTSRKDCFRLKYFKSCDIGDQ